ncbi:unnamed protein product [Paramecium sonneborni]|uniref:Transmembrane protein n=1 Tax=Paramecium sonneborni TaxID=65129 RepID=A0A8S1R412_9CILI|nr:unnamed protein product [Paramecium sonneborni]
MNLIFYYVVIVSVKLIDLTSAIKLSQNPFVIGQVVGELQLYVYVKVPKVKVTSQFDHVPQKYKSKLIKLPIKQTQEQQVSVQGQVEFKVIQLVEGVVHSMVKQNHLNNRIHNQRKLRGNCYKLSIKYWKHQLSQEEQKIQTKPFIKIRGFNKFQYQQQKSDIFKFFLQLQNKQMSLITFRVCIQHFFFIFLLFLQNRFQLAQSQYSLLLQNPQIN